MFNDMKDELSQKSPDIRLTQKEVLFISIHTGARQCDIIQFFGGLQEEPNVIPERVPQENRNRETAMEEQFQKILDMNVSKFLSTYKNDSPNSSIEYTEREILGPSQPQSQPQPPLRVPTKVKFADIGKSLVSPNTPEEDSALTLQTRTLLHKMNHFGTTLNTISNQNSTSTITKPNPRAQKVQDRKPIGVEALESQRYPDSEESSRELEMDKAARALDDMQVIWNTGGMSVETIKKIGKPMTGECVKSPQSVVEPVSNLKMSKVYIGSSTNPSVIKGRNPQAQEDTISFLYTFLNALEKRFSKC